MLGTDGPKIRRFVDSIETEARALIKEVSTLSIWGAISINEIWAMSYLERQILSETIKEKTEAYYGKKGFARSRF
jgi:hypothetical protein